MAHKAALPQRARRASALPMASTELAESSKPCFVASSSLRVSRSARSSISGRAMAARPSCESERPASDNLPMGPRFSSIHPRTTGSAVDQRLRRGSSLRATPSTTTMVFCSITSSGRVCMSKRAVISKSRVSSFAMEIWSARREWMGSPMARTAWAKSSTA